MDHSFYIEHLGCAKNRVDADGMAEALRATGWRESEDAEDAALIIVNSCGFIEPAKQESIETTLLYRERYPGKRIVLAGCMSQRYSGELASSLKEVDGFFGNRNPHRIVELVSRLEDGKKRVLVPETAPESGRSSANIGASVGYVKIAEGCNNRCTYCAIPFIRGPLNSRSDDDVVDDTKRLIDAGVFEINLIGQDIASYGTDRLTRPVAVPPLISLIERLLSIPGRFWLRMLYIHPDHFPTQLLELVAADERLVPYFDLPVQHASIRILEEMGRLGTGDTYLALIDRIRTALDAAVIRSTFLVGFPGEGRPDEEDLLEFQRRAEIDWLGVFEYSPEEGTAAFARLPRRARKSAARLKAVLEERQVPITERRMDRYVGDDLDVLIEEPLDKTGMAIGRGYLHAPEVDGNVVVHGQDLVAGTVRRCHIFKRNGIDLEARALDE